MPTVEPLGDLAKETGVQGRLGAEGHQAEPRPAALARDVADVDTEGLAPEQRGATQLFVPVPAEVHTFEKHVAGQEKICAILARNEGGVVADADAHPRRTGSAPCQKVNQAEFAETGNPHGYTSHWSRPSGGAATCSQVGNILGQRPLSSAPPGPDPGGNFRGGGEPRTRWR